MEAVRLHDEDLLARARAVLERNRAGDSTKPSPDLYPHQWNWDSCFIAIGVSRYDPERAQRELLALLQGQWTNGMVPQIVFNPSSAGYFPGPETWQSGCSDFSPRTLQTSGITQPPVLATAALAACVNDVDRARAARFAREVYPRVAAYHEFLYRERDPDKTGLVVVVHPWESGLDNSPPYLDAGSRVHLTYRPQYTRLDTIHVAAANRPTDKDYDLFVWLLEQMRAVQYDWSRYLPSATLQVEDVLFNAILCRANEDLERLAEIAGEDGARARAWASMTAASIDRKLWDADAGMYFSFDRVGQRLLTDKTVASLVPLYSPRLVARRAGPIAEALNQGGCFSPAGGYACATTAADSRWFDPQNYWLGPVWINTNWLLIQGLRAHGFDETAAWLASQTVDLVRRSGFREYFNPFTGAGYGTDSFSWSAALTVDLLNHQDVAGSTGTR